MVRISPEVCYAIEIRQGRCVRGQRWWALVPARVRSGVICPRRAIHGVRRAPKLEFVGIRQKDRETERQRDRETERQRDRETERQRDRETERQRDDGEDEKNI
jgi:hypothetical protein